MTASPPLSGAIVPSQARWPGQPAWTIERDATNGAPCLGIALGLAGVMWLGVASTVVALLV